MVKIWYPVKSTKLTDKELKKLQILQSLGVNNLILESKDENQEKLEELGFDVTEKDSLKLNTDFSDLLKSEMEGHQENLEELIKKAEQLDKDEIIPVTSDNNDKEVLYQELAFVLTLGVDAILPEVLTEKSDKITWNKIQSLLEFVKENNELLTIAATKLSLTEDNLIKVERKADNGEITAYFNVSTRALGFNSVSEVIQNYLVGQLLPKGVIIK